MLNQQVSIQNFYFKPLNMCKFAHDRKTHFIKNNKKIIFIELIILFNQLNQLNHKFKIPLDIRLDF